MGLSRGYHCVSREIRCLLVVLEPYQEVISEGVSFGSGEVHQGSLEAINHDVEVVSGGRLPGLGGSAQQASVVPGRV